MIESLVLRACYALLRTGAACVTTPALGKSVTQSARGRNLSVAHLWRIARVDFLSGGPDAAARICHRE